MITGDLGEDLEAAVLLLALWMAAAVPVMKWSARAVPLVRLTWVAFLTFATMLGMILAASLFLFVFHRAGSRPPLILMLGVFAIGAWLMDRRLRHENIAQPFPGIGARAMLSAFAATALAVAGILYSFAGTSSEL